MAEETVETRNLNELNEILHDDQCFDHQCANAVDESPFECIACGTTSGAFALFCAVCGLEKIAKLEAQLAEVKRVNAMQCERLVAMDLRVMHMAQEFERLQKKL